MASATSSSGAPRAPAGATGRWTPEYRGGNVGALAGDMRFLAPDTGGITAVRVFHPDVPDTRGWVDTLGSVRAALYAAIAAGTHVLCAVDTGGVRPHGNDDLGRAGALAVACARDVVVASPPT